MSGLSDSSAIRPSARNLIGAGSLCVVLLACSPPVFAQPPDPPPIAPPLQLPAQRPTPPPSVALAKQLSDAMARAADIAKPYTVIVRGPTLQPTQPNQQPQPVIGSGIIVSNDGLILTSNRNIRGAKSVRVILIHQRSDLPAQVVAVDSVTDLALIRIAASNLPVARFGDSDTVRVGDWVLAVGVPFGLPWSVTSGIISATNRSRGNNNVALMQTDTPINSGNVGGPLVNLDGEVIGICSALTSKSGAFEGVAYCIPINSARSFVASHRAASDLAATPPVNSPPLADKPPSRQNQAPRPNDPTRNDPTWRSNPNARAYLGAQVLDLDEETARQNNLSGTGGVMVVGVVQDSPADKAGLAAGDIITRFNGRNADTVAAMRLLLDSLRPGSIVPVQLYRDGKPLLLNVQLAEQ